jgi:hypothetical protein
MLTAYNKQGQAELCRNKPGERALSAFSIFVDFFVLFATDELRFTPTGDSKRALI